LDKRGKSLTPESRIEMLEERSWLLERREETQEDRALAIALNHTYGRTVGLSWLVVVMAVNLDTNPPRAKTTVSAKSGTPSRI